jgi:hypothetical protein
VILEREKAAQAAMPKIHEILGEFAKRRSYFPSQVDHFPELSGFFPNLDFLDQALTHRVCRNVPPC